MEGKRAPELACGGLLAKADAVFSEGGHALAALCANLSEAERTLIQADWGHGAATFVRILQMKTACWQCLPWQLAG
eukprot:403067-Alexandrium_andersonii.AAC.1